jgi:probable HAF family extracellular repeat protein
MPSVLYICSLAIAVMAAPLPATSEPLEPPTHFTAVDLGKLPRHELSLTAMSSNHRFAGTVSASIRSHTNFVTGPDGADPKVLGGSPGGINAAGEAVGYAYFPAGSHAYVTAPGDTQPIDLGTFGGPSSTAQAINDDGRIVGFADTEAFEEPHAFITAPGSRELSDLGVLSGDRYSLALGISPNGRVTGSSTGDSEHAFLTSPGGSDMKAISDNAEGHAVNDAGAVAGNVAGSLLGVYHAAISGPDGAGMKDVDRRRTLADSALVAINREGTAVGWAQQHPRNGRTGAILATYESEEPLDLTAVTSGLPEGVWLTNAIAIDDAGNVAANGSNLHAYLLVPD